MGSIISIWSGLDNNRRAMLIGALAVTIAAMGYMTSVARKPEMALLYAGLESDVAGDVVAALERMDTPAKVTGDAIYVAASQRDTVRLALAREGLPAQSQAGYELLDELNGFATTSEMFDAAFWRAKEGELARTILSVPGVRSARVHIGNAKRNAFDAKADATSAVVTVRMSRGPLGKQQALSIRYLVSLAIAGLTPEKVAVIDAERGVVLRPGDGAPEAEAMNLAGERERALENRLTRLIEARVGDGAARVSVSLELDMEREALSERILDPESRVTTGRESTDITQSATGTSGAVTIASNLPDGDAGVGRDSSSQRSEARERIDYDFSEVRREREKQPGAVKRVSVAVLVDEARTILEDGAIERTPRPPEEVEALRQLVESAIGFDESRGDVVTIETMAFQDTPVAGEEAVAAPVGQFLERHLITLIKIVIPAIVTLVLGLFVVRPLLAAQGAGARAGEAESDGEYAPTPLDFAVVDDVEGQLEGPKDSLEKLKEIASDKQDETAALLKTWLERGEEPA